MLRSWASYRRYKKLSWEWRNIVFYSETRHDWHHFQPLIEELTGRLQRKVCYVTSDPEDFGLKQSNPNLTALCIPEGFFLTVFFQMQQADVMVLTMMDLNNLHLKKSINPVHYVYLFHGMGSTHMVDMENSYDHYDSLFCVGPHHIAEIRKRESLKSLPAKNLVEYGYPRLEALMTEARDKNQFYQGQEHPVVLVAPTWGDDSIFNTCGETLIAHLLDNGFHVIMRPHYHTRRLTPKVLDDLISRFGQHERFEYVDLMGEMASLYRSHLLISDWSAMSIEYSLGLEKPVLFIDLPRRIRNPNWQELGLEPVEAEIRDKVGKIVAVDQLDQLAGKARELLSNPEQFKAEMRTMREQRVFNLGNSTTIGADAIAVLAEERATARMEADD